MDNDKVAIRCLLEKPLMFHEFNFAPPSSNIVLDFEKRLTGTSPHYSFLISVTEKNEFICCYLYFFRNRRRIDKSIQIRYSSRRSHLVGVANGTLQPNPFYHYGSRECWDW